MNENWIDANIAVPTPTVTGCSDYVIVRDIDLRIQVGFWNGRNWMLVHYDQNRTEYDPKAQIKDWKPIII